MRKNINDKGGDQDIAVGGAISCQVIPYGTGMDLIMALTEEEEMCIHIVQ
jgi:hypothetical protein